MTTFSSGIVDVRWYGAKGDANSLQSSSVSISSGSAALTVVGGSFASGDVSKSIMVPGAGVAGMPLVTTISAVTDATHVTLAASASTSVSGVPMSIAYGTNDTAAVQDFLTALSDGGTGNWDDGSFLVDANMLVLAPSATAPLVGDPNATLKIYQAPDIIGTAIFIYSGVGDGPLLTVRNPTQTSTSGTFYGNGSLGNLYFVDDSGSTLINRHGLLVRGLYGWAIGVVHGFKLAGSTVSFSRDVYSGDPDPYSTQNCLFRAVRGERCNAVAWDADCLQDAGNIVLALGAGGQPASALSPSAVSISSGSAALAVASGPFGAGDVGKTVFVPGAGPAGGMLITTISAFTDASHVTLSSNASTTLSAVSETITIGNPNGAMVNAGQGTQVHGGGSGANYGWAIQYGGTTNGNRQAFENISIGGSEKGIWVKTLQQFRISGRFEGVVDANYVNPLIPFGTTLWPTTCLKIGGGNGVIDGVIDLIIRVDSGTRAMLNALPAPFIDLSNDPNVGNVEINIILIDNAGMGLLDANSLLALPVSQFVTNLNVTSGVTIKVNDFAVVSNFRTTAIRTRLTTGGDAVIPSSGYYSSSQLSTGVWSASGSPDYISILDATNHWLNVRATGRYRLHCQLTLPVGSTSGNIAAGSLAKCALIDDDGSGNLNLIDETWSVVADAGGKHVIEMNVAATHLIAGHRVWISLQSAGQTGTCYLVGMSDWTAANFLELALLSAD